MKRSQFVLACLTALTATSGSHTLEACDRCDGRGKGQTCATCDDRGLIDAFDKAASRMQTQMSNLAVLEPRTSSSANGRGLISRKTNACKCQSKKACSCDAGLQYGDPHTQFPHQDSYEVVATPELLPLHPPLKQPSASQPQTLPPQSQPAQSPADASPIESGKPTLRNALPTQPVPPRQRLEATPRPDHEVDPFTDDTAGRVRRVPARTIEYRQPPRSYGQVYDPQASNARPASLPAAAELANSSRQLSATRSHRQSAGGPVEVSLSDHFTSPVIPAAGVGPAASVSVGSSLAGQGAATTPAVPSNPLRNN